MRGPAIRPVVIAAGGTGGHLFPAEALAAALVARGHRIVLMTDARSAGHRSAVFEGRERFVLGGGGVAGHGVTRAARGAAGMVAGVFQARRLLTRLNAAAVVGFGGYPSVGPVVAARLVQPRPLIVLHEQNAVLGRANRVLAQGADIVALSFATTLRLPTRVATAVTGNPVRPTIAALAGLPYVAPAETVSLLVLGGSLGARVMSQMVPPAIAALPERLRRRLEVTQQCRPEDLQNVRAAYAALAVRATLASFFDDMPGLLAAAHLVIARAGASTVAELALAGRPSILVPLPHAIDDHQTANARALAGSGAAWVMPQSTLSPHTLAARLLAVLSPDILTQAAACAAGLGRADGADALADLLEHRLAARVP